MTGNGLEKALYFHNPWWREKNVPREFLPSFHRPVLKELNKYIETLQRIIIIKGPRRTGKTTLFFQIMESLISKGTNPFDMLFLSFDDLNLRQDLEKIFSLYERIRGKTLKESPVFCFLDEVHFLDNWSLIVKKYFDKKYPIKFLISSSSASLFKKSLESLAGRTVEEIILPFTFKEFAIYHFREDKNFMEFLNNKRLTAYENELKILFRKYLNRGGFPHLLEIEEPGLWQRLLREDVLEKVIFRDLVQLYGIREPEKLEKTFLYLANTSAQILNLSNLARNIGISRQHLERYIYYLEQAYLIFQIGRFSPSAAKTLRSASKLHLIDSGLNNVFSTVSNQDFIIESLIARHLLFREGKMFYYRNQYEVDLVLSNKKDIIPIEIKNKDAPERADFKGLISFMKKYRIKKGLLLCRDYEGEEKIEDMKIKIEPFWSWLLKKGA
ncbi:MAG: ATP-binding protein [Nitrospirae bacterium]|nr:ATP-binding protein [Nitrospirota bacterium]